MVNAGKTEGSSGGGDLIKPALARGELRCIGATTLAEYKLYVEKDAAFERRFQPVRDLGGVCAMCACLLRDVCLPVWVFSTC